MNNSKTVPVHPQGSPKAVLRDVCKHLVMLEERLTPVGTTPNEERVRKHFLAVEALLEEGIAASPDLSTQEMLSSVFSRMVYLQQAWATKGNKREISNNIRAIRSQLSDFCFSSSTFPASSFLPAQMGEIKVPGRKIWLDILVAGLGIYLGYFLVDKLGPGRKPK